MSDAFAERRAIFEAAKAGKHKPKPVERQARSIGEPGIPWDEIIFPTEADVKRFHENPGRYYTTGIPAEATGTTKEAAHTNRKFVMSIKQRLMTVRKEESWSVVLDDGFVLVAYSGALVHRKRTRPSTVTNGAKGTAEGSKSPAEGTEAAAAS